jgi:hypothetical protein
VDGEAIREVNLDNPSQYQLCQHAYDFAKDNCISAKGVKIILKQG